MDPSDYLSENLAKWQEAAAKGDAGAKYNLALCYIFGKDVKRDRYRAYDLLCEACEELNKETQREELGLAYYNRAMTAIHLSYIQDAIISLQNAVTYGYKNAYLPLIYISSLPDYYNEEVFKDMQENFPACAKYFEALNYILGRYGYPQDEQKAIELFTESAEEGYTFAGDELLQLYVSNKWLQDGINLLDKIEHLLPLASIEYAGWACTVVGMYLISGIKCQQNIHKAQEYYTTAWETYHYIPVFMQEMSMMFSIAYETGFKLDKDILESFVEVINERPEICDDQSAPIALLGLAECYEFGKFSSGKDLSKALELYRKSQIAFDKQLAFLNVYEIKHLLDTSTTITKKESVKGILNYASKAKEGISRIEKQQKS